MKYVCIFMAFITICTFCGCLFGFATGGTFIKSFQNFSSTVNSVDKTILKPLDSIAKFFGFKKNPMASSVFIYRLQFGDDITALDYIPSNAVYCAYLFSFDVSGKHYILPGDVEYFIFFDEDGLPIDCIVFNCFDEGPLSSGDFVSSGHRFVSVQFENSYFAVTSKMLYFDITVTTMFKRNYEQWKDADKVSHRAYLFDHMCDYQFQGSFTDLYDLLKTYSSEVTP